MISAALYDPASGAVTHFVQGARESIELNAHVAGCAWIEVDVTTDMTRRYKVADGALVAQPEESAAQ